MRLTDLDPRWLEIDGRKVGMIFRCPHANCRMKDKQTWLSCFFEPMPVLNGGNWPSRVALFEKAIGEDEDAYDVVPCNKTNKWVRTSDDFATMSITPSVDASAAGHWHGFITGGEIH